MKYLVVGLGATKGDPFPVLAVPERTLRKAVESAAEGFGAVGDGAYVVMEKKIDDDGRPYFDTVGSVHRKRGKIVAVASSEVAEELEALGLMRPDL